MWPIQCQLYMRGGRPPTLNWLANKGQKPSIEGFGQRPKFAPQRSLVQAAGCALRRTFKIKTIEILCSNGDMEDYKRSILPSRASRAPPKGIIVEW